MHFEKALNNFITEITRCYGYEPKIKSMELSAELYSRVEFEIREKSLWQPEKPQPRVIQFYSCNDVISLHKEIKPQPEKPQRTIVEVKSNANGQWIVRSNDGKLFIHGVDRSGLAQWLPYPDLPQD